MANRTKATVKAGLAAALGVIAALGVRTAFAQTMGEYGMATGHAAASASQMPAIQAPLPSFASSGSDRNGSTHTEELRSYEDPRPGSDRHDKDENSNNSNDSSEDWVQVK